ncbi:DUF6187 family protein [Streptomyces sp. NPDC051567]|uniref:DUF6187 family protein n=1 Tax=Streptomyces sp. NPDC051567 TaxID=3365660 RepID=UPI0037B6E1BD
MSDLDDPHALGGSDDSDDFDTRFSLTSVDGPPLTETGVMLMGLDAERLLAGLGLAALTDDPALTGDPAQVALAVDRARHGVGPAVLADLVGSGAQRWCAVRPALAPADRTASAPAALRTAWDQVLRALAHRDIGAPGPATTAYLAACWLRHEEIDRWAGRPAPAGG